MSDDGKTRYGPPSGRAAPLVWAAAGAALLAALLVGLMGAGASADRPPDRVRAIDTPATLDSASAERVARRVSAALADAGAIWRHDLRWRYGRGFTPPTLVKFAGLRPSPCGGHAGVSGILYCPSDRTLSVDLAFLAGVTERLGRDGDRALALLVARGMAGHVQAELAILGDAERLRPGLAPGARAALDRDLALQGDCFAGIWAQRAGRRLGAVEPGFWGGLLQDLRDSGPEPALAGLRLDIGGADEREEAFARGYASGTLPACLSPTLSGVLR